MCKYDKAVGPFWVVWDKVVGPVAPFDSDKVVRNDDFWRLDVDFDEAWEEVKEFNQYPNKSSKHYPHGEVMFDPKGHTFVVIGTPKLMCDHTFQKKIIRMYGLSQFTKFVEADN